MENKKSFILYADVIHTAEKLPDKDAGELFKHILRYVNDLDPHTDNLLVQLTFEPIKQQLKRDLERWSESRERRAEAGRKGGKARALKQKQAMLEELEANQANQAVNVNGTVNVNDNVNVIKESSHSLLWWLDDNAPRVQELNEPITDAQARRLLDEFDIYFIQQVFKNMHNYRKLTSTVVSANLTFRKWAAKDLKDYNNGKGKTRAEQALENIGNNGNLDSLEGLGSF